MRFTALLHHVSVDLLRNSYYNLKKGAAAGVDGMTWQEYGGNLEERLASISTRNSRFELAGTSLPRLRHWLFRRGAPLSAQSSETFFPRFLISNHVHARFRKLCRSKPAWNMDRNAIHRSKQVDSIMFV